MTTSCCSIQTHQDMAQPILKTHLHLHYHRHCRKKTAFLEETPVPPPPFSTPPKLTPVDRILKEYPGKGKLQLRLLATVLARDIIFGREVLGKCSLSGRKSTDTLDPKKLNYIKTVIRSRVSEMPEVEFEYLWLKCRQSISKSCQALRTRARRKI